MCTVQCVNVSFNPLQWSHLPPYTVLAGVSCDHAWPWAVGRMAAVPAGLNARPLSALCNLWTAAKYRRETLETALCYGLAEGTLPSKAFPLFSHPLSSVSFHPPFHLLDFPPSFHLLALSLSSPTPLVLSSASLSLSVSPLLYITSSHIHPLSRKHIHVYCDKKCNNISLFTLVC